MVSIGRWHVGFALLVKVAVVLVVSLLLLAGGGYAAIGAWAVPLHLVIVAAIGLALLWGSVRHRNLIGGGMLHDLGKPSGIVLHGAAAYDLLVVLLTLGREGRFGNFC